MRAILTEVGQLRDQSPYSRLTIRPCSSPGIFVCRLVNLRQLEWVGERVPLRRTRIQAAHGTVPLKCACNTLPARPGIVYRSALGVQRGRPLPTSEPTDAMRIETAKLPQD